MEQAICTWANAAKDAATPLVAAFVAYVAWRQWRTAQTKLRLDLFDKRFACYHRVQSALDELLKELGPSTDIGCDGFQLLLQKFYRAQTEAHLLFDDNVDSTLKRIYSELQSVMIAGTNLQFDNEAEVRVAIANEVVAHRSAVMHLQQEFYWACERYIRIEAVFHWPAVLLRKISRYSAAARTAISTSSLAISRFLMRRS